jgi:aminoglycoside phosphotransferase (APT) family kinase protein
VADAPAAVRGVRIEASVERLLHGATSREDWKTTDSLSGSRLERVAMGRAAHVVKYVSVDDDWIMRATGDLHCRLLTLLASGVLETLPDAIDHTMVACAPYVSPRGHRSAALLMRDVSGDLVPAGSEAVDLELHRAFLAHMAQMHAAYLGFEEGGTLFPPAHHYVFLTPLMAQLETASGRSDPVPPAVRDGWARMDEHHPRQARLLRELASDPSPLLRAMRVGPVTLVHGDWKLGNLGARGPRTILLDWDRCGEGPPLIDLAWYLAVNCDRLPEAKEDAIAAYRGSLEAAGVETSPWWKPQLTAALAGAFLQLGWSKTTDAAEFGWWTDRLDEALPLL